MTESLRHCPRVVVDVRGCYGVKVGCVAGAEGSSGGIDGEIKKIENPVTHVRIGARARTSRTSARAYACAYASG